MTIPEDGSTRATQGEQNGPGSKLYHARTITLEQATELDDIKDDVQALELTITGYLTEAGGRGGVYADGLEAQAAELTRRLERLSEDIGGDRTEA